MLGIEHLHTNTVIARRTVKPTNRDALRNSDNERMALRGERQRQRRFSRSRKAATNHGMQRA
jgi:hypothetical protein